MTIAEASGAASLLPVGQLITIVLDSDETRWGDKPEGYASRIEDVRDNAVVVSMPMRKRSLVRLPLNSTVSAFFNRNGARYYFRAVVGSQTVSPLPILHLTQVGDVRKQERRAHVRVDVLVEPIQMVVISEDGEGLLDPRSSLVVNISAGGLGLVCRQPLPIGSQVHVVLDLPRELGLLEADAEVVRCLTLDLGGIQKWQVGVSFQKMSQKQRDRIAAFVLFQQQMLRRRGLL